MTRQRIRFWQWTGWQLAWIGSLAVVSGWVSVSDRALAQFNLAQIQPDNTLGNERSLVLPDRVIKGLPAELIDGGAARGSSLFHSFLDFNIRDGQRVYFANPQGIANIFSRITGNNASNIFGTLGVNGAANLFLLNPNGILFGANARLDVAGSFVASTADRIAFPDGFDFGTTDPQAPPLLTMSVTPGLQYGDSVPGATIVNRGQLTTGQDLTLAADRLDIQGQLQAGRNLSLQAQTTVQVRDTITTPFIAAAGDDLTIQGNQGIDILALNHPGDPFQSGGNLSLISDGQISADAHFAGGGNFSAQTVSGNPAQLISLYDPIVTMAGDINLGGFYGGASLAATAGGNITYGNVGINAIDPAVHPTNPALILNAGGTITGNGAIFTFNGMNNLIVDFQSQGNIDIRDIYTNGGSITLTSTAGNINTSRGPRLVSSGGAITLNASGNITTRDLGSASGTTGGDITLTSTTGSITTGFIGSGFDNSMGTAGAIRLSANSDITTGGIVAASGNANGNDITIATNTGNISTQFLTTRSQSAAIGSGGAVNLFTNNGDITTANINTASEVTGSGNGGTVRLETRQGSIRTAGIYSNTYFRPSLPPPFSGNGNGGNVTILATNGIQIGDIFANSQGRIWGEGGVINLFTSSGDITTGRVNSYVISTSPTVGSDITIVAPQGRVNTGREVLSVSNSSHAGDITIQAGLGITGERIASYSRSELGQGNAGVIRFSTSSGNITLEELYAFSESSRTATGNGGNIFLTAPAGNITIAQNVFSYSDSRASTSGNGGLISFGAGGDISTGLVLSYSRSATLTAGRGGDVTIASTNGNLNTRLINASGGSGGDIAITSSEHPFSLINGNIISDAIRDGDGGEIQIAASAISLRNSELTTTATAQGSAGRILIQTPGQFNLDRSRLFTSLQPGAIGQGGDITILAGSVTLQNFSLIDTATLGQGNAGSVRISANQIALDRSSIFSITSGQGNGGTVTLQSPGTVALTNHSNISTAVDTRAVGSGGDVQIDAQTLSITGGSQLQALTRGQGSSGNIQLAVPGGLTIAGISPDGFLSGVFTSSEAGSGGQGGNITVSTNGMLRLTEGSVFNAQTASAFKGGDITVTANTVELQNGGQLLTTTFGEGQAGNITVNASQRLTITGTDANFTNRPIPRPAPVIPVTAPTTIAEREPNNNRNQAQAIDRLLTLNSVDNPNPNVEFASQLPFVSIGGFASNQDTNDYYVFTVEAAGTRGIFDIDTNSLQGVRTEIRLLDDSGNQLAASNSSLYFQGAGGSVPLPESGGSSRDPYLRYVFNTPGTYYLQVRRTGAAGRYELQASLGTPNVVGSVVNSTPASGLFAQTQAGGVAGSITVNTPQVNVLNQGRISASTISPVTSGVGGNVTINASEVNLAGNSRISAGTEGAARGGNLTLQPTYNQPDLTVNLRQGSQISTSTSGRGQGGTLTVAAPRSITVQGDGAIAAGTTGAGSGGAIRVHTNHLQIRDRAALSATTTASGTGGSITVNADRMTVRDRGQLRTTTTGSGQAGDMTLNLYTNLTLSDRHTGLFANTTPGSTGDGGSIFIDPITVLIQRGAGVAVDSQGLGRGGSIYLQGGTITLDDRGFLSAETASAQGGNITVNAHDRLILRRNSLISATAGTAQSGGDGGNITISAPFVLGVLSENSDIVANAFTGRGGRIDITANGIFGLRYQPQLTPNSDITASSQFGLSGTVTLNLLGIDPSRGFVSLPFNLVDPATQISQTCAQRSQNASSFVATGRGGIPNNPEQPLRNPAIVTPWVSVEPDREITVPTASVTPSATRILEAQDWVVDAQGRVLLVATTDHGLVMPGGGVAPVQCSTPSD